MGYSFDKVWMMRLVFAESVNMNPSSTYLENIGLRVMSR